MAPSRAYVPSRALLRALSRPIPPPCPFARLIPTQFVRDKRTKAAKEDVASRRPGIPLKEVSKIAETITSRMESDEITDKMMRPPSDKELESGDLPVINWYEQDLDKGTPPRLIESIATAEDWKRDKETYTMIEESLSNPEYDNAKLNRRLIDSLIANPNFADLTQDLKDIKEGITTKEELEALDEQSAKDAEPEMMQFNANLRMTAHQALQDLIDDPDVGDVREQLREVQAKMPEMDDIDNPEFQIVLGKAMAQLEGNEAFQKKMAGMADEPSDNEFEKEWNQLEKNIDEALDENGSDNADLSLETPDDLQDVDKLLYQMRDVLKSIGGDSSFEAELDAVLSQDPEAAQEGEFEREMDPEELAEEIKKLVISQSKAPPIEDDDAEENVPAELQAKIDQIMQDPKLMEKLMYIQKLISESEHSNTDLTAIAHETAPDPHQLDASRTATLQQQMLAARQTPEHIAALQRLRVTLLPPFSISPALKSFNQAIELAYIGANDDIRRILWRAYHKARTLPTFLQNMSDDAWDILYYSQAVTWGSNQNRQDHLRMMLADLKSLGREGPPTHPRTLVKRGHAEQVGT